MVAAVRIRMLLLALLATVVVWPSAADSELPSLPGLPSDEESALPPLPGSAEIGQNPLNAVALDTLMLVDGLAAGGAGIALGYERSFGTILGLEVEVGYLGAAGADSTTSWRLDLASFLAGIRLSVMQTAVNGPFLGISGGVAIAWFPWGDRRYVFAWPQGRIDAGMKLSLGKRARGFFLEPRVGYKFVLIGAETENLPTPRYGGLTGGLRIGYSF